MRLIYPILLGLLSLTVPINSQDLPKLFSLEEAVSYALAHNYSAINAERDIQDAQKLKWATIASGLPQISGAVNYQNQIKQPVSLIPAEFFGGDAGTFVPITFGPPKTTSAVATVRQKIFDGSYMVGVQAAQAYDKFSQTNKEKTELEVRYQVVQAYGNVLLAQASVQVLTRNTGALEKNLFETQKLFENGLAEEESVEQLQITYASLQNQLRNTTQLAGITIQMLNTIMGLPLDHPTVLTQNLDELVLEQTRLDLLDTPLNINQNVDFRLAENYAEQRYYELKLAKSRALPTLNAFLNYGKTAFDDPTRYFNAATQNFESSILGFDLNIPIFSSLERSANTQRAKIALDKAKTELEQAEKQIELQLQKARTDYQLAIETFETSKANLALAERIENKNEIKYTEGIASSFELRQAQTQLYAAQQEYLQAMVGVINAKSQLENILNLN
jgi:outer membrane protein TolC